MALTEFGLIRRYFDRAASPGQATHASGVALGIGDDCALLRVAPGMELAVSTDMLVEGRHFSPGADARNLGHKSLAVNLSDLAAMGAAPRWATLALSLPEANPQWLEDFSEGLFALAGLHGLSLVGGDTTRGPLTISITVLGELPAGLALYRAGARVGDDLWVSGELGGASLGLAHARGEVKLERGDAAAALKRLHRPEPRVELGERLRGIATSAIDVSDGLAGDLMHILERSGTGALIEYARLPRPSAFHRLAVAEVALEARCVLAGGDDYELAFTAPQAAREELQALSKELGLALTRIGAMQPPGTEPQLLVLDAAGRPMPSQQGFDHFARFNA